LKERPVNQPLLFSEKRVKRDLIPSLIGESSGWAVATGPLREQVYVVRSCRALSLLSIVIPARDEEGCIRRTLESLHIEMCAHDVPHEIVVVDDGSRDRTWEILMELKRAIPQLVALKSEGKNGFGRAVVRGLDAMSGDAVIVMMGDDSDDPRQVVRYWEELNQGWDCVFGSRFIEGGSVIDYPKFKLVMNRLANRFLKALFAMPLNDTTNGFKAYRREVIEDCRPLTSAHFNLTVELPLKAIVRGYSWTTVPITYRNRRAGVSKWSLVKMGARYLLTSFSVWLEREKRLKAEGRLKAKF
jgi:dolichol-phosphate mannosyltransferase